MLDVLADLVDVERLLRDQDDVRPAGDARVQRDPARVPAHHLDDQRPVVTLGGRMEPVDSLHRDIHCSVKPESQIGRAEVVVNCLGNANHFGAGLVQPGRHAQGVLTANGHQSIDAEAFQVLLDALDASLAADGRRLAERVGPRGAEYGPAAGQNAANRAYVQHHRVALERPAPAIPEADELQLVLGHAGPDDRSDHRVEAGAIAASGEDSHSHRFFLSRLLPPH